MDSTEPQDSQKSQKIRYMAQITMLQNDKENLQNEVCNLKEEVEMVQSKLTKLEGVESDRIKAIAKADLIEQEKFKKIAEIEALKTTIEFQQEELDFSKLRNRATADKYAASMNNEKKFREQIVVMESELEQLQSELVSAVLLMEKNPNLANANQQQSVSTSEQQVYC